jgi:poly-gamma-glutamate capsule biosynthesis protein CapA/YwtB (metallophosphatase superfamily)
MAGAGDLPAGPPTTTPATTTTAPPPREVTLVAAGDVLLHSPLWSQAAADGAAGGRAGRDFGPLMADVRGLISDADVAICHLETPIAGPGQQPAGYPVFAAPPEIVPALAHTGFDACTTASNHTFDQGAAGIDRTLQALESAGIAHAGSARTADEATRVTLLRVAAPDRDTAAPRGDGIEIALLSYTYGFNGIPPPDGETWRSNPIDEARILADARTARQAGAEIVVAALHWGEEYRSDPTAEQRALAPALVRSPDVDLVLGHHAHVVQPLERVDGEWVVYGMGNFLAHQGTFLPANQEGLVVRFTFREGAQGWQVTTAEYAAVHVTRSTPVRMVDVGQALATGEAPSPVDPARLREAWDRTAAAVGALGAFDAGLVPLGGPPPG